MKRTLLIALIAILAAGCGKPTSKEPELQENTEEYFAAHGIVPGQVNELRIGGTLFRFPAGVGLNPYTAQEAIRTIDGSPMTLSSKECLEQGKCERVATPIVKGQADKVTFYLMPERGYAPNPSPFGGGIRVTISKHGFYKWDGINANPDELLKRIEGRKIIDHPKFGLREYVAPGSAGSTYYKSLKADIKSASGHGQFFECQSASSGLCFRSYWNENGNYQVEVDVGNPFFLDHWQEVYPAVDRFVDSVVAQ
jgi:hypothetical protein